MENTVYILLALLASIGLVQLVGGLFRWLLRPKGAQKSYYIVPLCSNRERVEQLLRYQTFKFRWGMDSTQDYMLLVDFGMDAETQKICEEFTADLRGVLVCYPHELEATIRLLANLQTD